MAEIGALALNALQCPATRASLRLGASGRLIEVCPSWRCWEGSVVCLCVRGVSPLTVLSHKFHPYEGHSLASVVYPIRLMATLGVQNLISEPPLPCGPR